MSEKDIRKAVALQYAAPDAPKVVATGKGDIAEAIVAKAREAGVPIEENPALADALSTLKLDETIPVDLYKAVAAVIAAVLRAARKA
ncbi:EscU/YscU/HrcU family type III secretion system export apparatus switch protein [Pleomorphomonas koreensis]|uniref:EscU/YscU/HrcU family type III secretion system export apparatus switch protein n=1 Tax=Pleomorphomonas koreensis TaxID=257440 RepID=UPI0003FA10AE|nr:EscU/YscU/HrcU family type III secretion system export apparatus switch protein [Pleomorphomonas koreensis]